MRRVLLTCTALLALPVTGCVPPAATPTPPPRALNLSYTPPNAAQPSSAGVTLALVQPEWSQEDKTGNIEALPVAMKNDFMELLTARGYTTRGPFDSYQAMVYPDKNGSDLVLTPQLQLRWEFADVKPVVAGGRLGALVANAAAGMPFVLTGTTTIRGRVNLVLTESVTNERMWSKSIAVEPVTVQWTGTTQHTMARGATFNQSSAAVWEAVHNDPGFKAQVYPKLEAMYQAVLQKGWDYLDPREVAQVKAQASQVRKRKVY
jgi:hypothetical protein